MYTAHVHVHVTQKYIVQTHGSWETNRRDSPTGHNNRHLLLQVAKLYALHVSCMGTNFPKGDTRPRTYLNLGDINMVTSL